MALSTSSHYLGLERRVRRSLIGASIGLVLAAEFVTVLELGPVAGLPALLLAMAVGAAPRSTGLLPVVSTLVGGLVGLKAVNLVAGLMGQPSGWLSMVGFLTGTAVVLEMQPTLRRNLSQRD